MEQPQFENMSLANLKGGAAIELFDVELKNVLNNIVDLNTSTGARSITLKVVFKPNSNRERMDIAIACSSKLAPLEVCQTTAFVGVDPKVGTCAVEPDLNQMKLFGKSEPEKVTEVIPITRVK